MKNPGFPCAVPLYKTDKICTHTSRKYADRMKNTRLRGEEGRERERGEEKRRRYTP